MPHFLNDNDMYRVLQRELPEGVYPDSAPSGFYSTADMAAIGRVGATGYGNLERVYSNYWPQTADEKIGDWEVTAFGVTLDASLTLTQRRNRIIAQIRSRKGLTISDMVLVVQSIIGIDKLVDIGEWGCSSGGWQIGVSQLGIETYLNGYPSRLIATGPLICAASAATYGVTPDQWAQMKAEAYTYQVNIYGYTLTAAEAAAIDAALAVAEPARSTHVIVSGLDPANMLNGGT